MKDLNRYEVKNCPDCNGTGRKDARLIGSGIRLHHVFSTPCSNCKGLGVVVVLRTRKVKRVQDNRRLELS
jgi:DnaJ-class molecular chaperone